MRTNLTIVSAVLLLTISTGFCAEDASMAKKSSPEFERMKSLVGTWKGTTDIGQGPMEMTVQYRLLAAGTVLEERIFPGTPHEMVTMYHDKGSKLALTHYCVMGNRPAMVLKSADEKTLKFDFDKSCGINPAKESHMHALTIKFEDQETIKTSCKAMIDGKVKEDHATTLKRVKT